MKLKFELIDNLFTVHKFPAGHDIPKHIYEQQFYFIGKTDNELSVVCNSALVLNSETSEPGWACLRIAGKMDFSLLGVLAEVTAIIAEAEISIFVLSTFDTDYILLPADKLAPAREMLLASGHSFID